MIQGRLALQHLDYRAVLKLLRRAFLCRSILDCLLVALSFLRQRLFSLAPNQIQAALKISPLHSEPLHKCRQSIHDGIPPVRNQLLIGFPLFLNFEFVSDAPAIDCLGILVDEVVLLSILQAI